jgi:hypothetical protein
MGGLEKKLKNRCITQAINQLVGGAEIKSSEND